MSTATKTAAGASHEASPSGAHLLALPELASRAGESAHLLSGATTGAVESPGGLLNPLRHVRAKLTVVVGSAELTIGDLLGAKEHQVIALDRAVEAPVDILLEGHVVARGTLVAVDDRFGVRITEVATSLDGPLRHQDGSCP